jgi:membrane-associated phospholipid phosphatase
MSRALAVALGALLTLPPRAASADDLAFEPTRHGPLLVGGGLLFVLSETLLKDALAPDDCRWCADNALDRGVRDGLRWDDPAAAASASNWVGYVAVPVLTIGGVAALGAARGPDDAWWTDGLIVAETAILASDFTNLVKDVVGRERPFVHALAPGDKPKTQEDNLSFFSGHSSLTMSLAVSAGTIASLRGYKLAPVVWGTGVGLALTTGYLRIAADRHWSTDVVTGWAVGAAFGVAVPYFLHRKQHGSDVTASVSARAVSLSFAW